MGRRERSEYLQYLGISSGISTGGQMAGRRWSSVYTLAVELLRPGGIVSIVGGNIAHTSHSYTDTGIFIYLQYLHS